MSLFISEARSGVGHFIYYAITIVAVLMAYVFGQLPLYLLIDHRVSTGLISAHDAAMFWTNPDFNLIGLASYTGLFFLMLGHIFAAIALWCCVRFIHKRRFISVVTSRRPFDIGRFVFAFILWMVLTASAELVMYFLDPANYSFAGVSWKTWIPLVLISLVILPVQTSIEEIFVRGYLFQGIGLAARSGIVAVILTSVFFAAMHLGNPEIAKFGYSAMVIYYVSVAVILALITYLDEGLEMALGLHAATNIYGAAFVTFEGSVLQTDALWTVGEVNAWWMTLAFYLSVIIFFIIVRRKYALKPFSSLFNRINIQSSELKEEI